MTATLAPDELARAARYRFERDRARFVVARATLRALLAAYTARPAASLGFETPGHGKPLLADPDPGQLRFNLSHSGAVALYAVASDREVGVDVERVDPRAARDVSRILAPAEATALEALPADQRLDAFFACWTRKEAYLKARGLGLALGLDRFAVSLAPDEPVRLAWSADDPAEVTRWRLEALAPGPGYAGALAAEGWDWHLRLWQWTSPCPCGSLASVLSARSATR
jgi:4'-phosphopantetheinyl transferase